MSNAVQHSRRELSEWMVQVARPVMGPLVASTFFRMVDQLAGIALFGFAVLFIADFGFWRPIAGSLAEGLDGGGLLGAGGSLWPMIAMLVGLSLVKALARYLEQFLGHLVAFRALELLRTHTFGKLWPQAPAVMYGARSGDMLERLTKDIDRLEVFYAHTIAPAITGVLTPLIVVLSMGFWGSWPMAGVLAVGLAIQILVVPLLGMRATRRNAERLGQLRGELTQSVTDSVQGRTEVVGYSLQVERQQHARGIGEEILAEVENTSMIVGVRKFASLLVSWVTPVLVLIVGLTEAFGAGPWNGGLLFSEADRGWTMYIPADEAGLFGLFSAASQFGPVLAATAMVVAFRTFVPSKEFEELQHTLDNTFASAGRLYTLTHQEPLVKNAGGAGAVVGAAQALPEGPIGFSVQDVTYAYPDCDRAAALEDSSAEFPAGKHTVVVGTSGSGKSTLMQLLMRYADPDSGRIVVVGAGDDSGVDMKSIDLDELRGAMTYVSQTPFLFNRTVRENLELGNPDASVSDVWAACTVAHIADHVEKLDKGLDTPVGELAGTWSGGQRARLALARALVTKPRVLILDEYTAHLDPELAASVRRAVREAFPDLTLVEVTHRVASALEADHVVVVDDGRVVEQGTAAELMNSAETQGTAGLPDPAGTDSAGDSAFRRLLARDK